MERIEHEIHQAKEKNKMNKTFIIYNKVDKIPVRDHLYFNVDKKFIDTLK